MNIIETPKDCPETKNEISKDPNQTDIVDFIEQQISDPEVAATLKKFSEAIKRNEEAKKQNQNKPEEKEAEIIYLPQEATGYCAMPNFCLRSALFGVVEKGQRKLLDSHVIAAQKGYSIQYSGKSLDQFDCDVWLAVKYLCLQHPLRERVCFSAPEIATIMQVKDGSATRRAIEQSIDRLSQGALRVKAGNVKMVGHLIDWGIWDEKEHKFCIRLGKELIEVFKKDQYTILEMAQRRLLTKGLASWLHGYWASHDYIYSVHADTIQNLCGSKASQKEFRRLARKALEELVGVGFLGVGIISRNGFIEATKAPTVKAFKREGRKQLKTLKEKPHG